MQNDTITILSPAELVEMRKACKLAAAMLQHLGKMIKPGITTQDIDDEAVRFTKARGAKNGPLGFHGFTRSICTSINEVVCHGIPTTKDVLKDGDTINVDVSPTIGGYFGDTSRTFFVGNVTPENQKLVEVTEECMWRGIKEVAPGKRLGDIGAAIQEHAESSGYSVVREFVGHGIGKEFHCAPQVPHYGKRGKGKRLLKGMTFTIEPMINAGVWQSYTLDDGWTAITEDHKRSAQFEHVILVTDDGFEVLTLPEGQAPRY